MPPFADIGRDRTLLYYNIINVDVPAIGNEWSEEFREFVKMCLKRDPNERGTVKDLLRSSFLVDLFADEAKLEACK